MSAQVIYCRTHGIYFVQLTNAEMTGNNESFNVVKLVLINWQVSSLFTYLLDNVLFILDFKATVLSQHFETIL
jgi:hypothetical protein